MKMKALKQIIPMITAAGLLAFGSGCASSAYQKSGTDFSQYHTFAMLPLPVAGTYQDPGVVARLGRPAQEAATETLTAKGFKAVSEGEADFVVKMTLDWLPEQGRMEQRILVIKMIDRKSKEVIWSKVRARSTDSTLPASEVAKGVTDMLKGFPPGSR